MGTLVVGERPDVAVPVMSVLGERQRWLGTDGREGSEGAEERRGRESEGDCQWARAKESAERIRIDCAFETCWHVCGLIGGVSTG